MYILQCLIAFLYFIKIDANLILKNSYREKDDNLIESASKIANHNFNYRIQTVIVSNDVDEFIVNKFIKSYKGTVMMEKRDALRPQQVVLIMKSYFSLMKILYHLKPDLKGKTLLESGAHFLVILLSYPHRLERINKLLWSYYATDVVILVKDEKQNIALYTYFPYKNPKSCHNVEPTLLGFWDNGTILSKDLYPDKMSKMQGCPLYISTNKIFHPVTEQKATVEIIKKTIIRILADIMNFTPIISTKNYLTIDSDDAKKWSETLDDIISGYSNISTCSILPGMERMGMLDYSPPYFRIKIAWIAPPVLPGAIWWRLLSPLNGYLWVVLLLVVFTVKSVPFIMKLTQVKQFLRNNFKDADKLQNVAIRIWAVMMGQPIRVMPRRFRDFYILGLWIWFTFVVRNAYQSVLIGALKSDVIVGKFTNLKEAEDYGYSFGGKAGVLAHFEHDPLIRNGFEVIPESEFENNFRMILDGRKRFLLAVSLEYVWAYCMSQGINDNECGYILPDSIMTIPLLIWMRKNSPFMRPISVWLPRMIESGILDNDATNVPIYSNLKISEPSPLTGNQVTSCILCLVVGYIVSILVLFLEIIAFKVLKIRALSKIKRQKPKIEM